MFEPGVLLDAVDVGDQSPDQVVEIAGMPGSVGHQMPRSPGQQKLRFLCSGNDLLGLVHA